MFYERFAEICKAKGTSPCAVALSAGLSKSNITGWKRGSSPTVASVGKLAEKLGVPLAEFFKEPENRETA